LIVYDNESSDNSVELLHKYDFVEVRSFSTSGSKNNELQSQIKNECWKEARGIAHYVVVCDFDEVLWCPDVKKQLGFFKKRKIDIIKPRWYDLLSENFPQYDKHKLLHEILDYVADGSRWTAHHKYIIFNPNTVLEINYSRGAHSISPIMIAAKRCNFVSTNKIKLLHCKHIGIAYVIENSRNQVTRQSMLEDNLKSKHYIIWSKEYRERFYSFYQHAFSTRKLSNSIIVTYPYLFYLFSWQWTKIRLKNRLIIFKKYILLQ
jgi:hypothetical protein